MASASRILSRKLISSISRAIYQHSHSERSSLVGFSNGCSVQDLLLKSRLMFVSHFSMYILPDQKSYNATSISIPLATSSFPVQRLVMHKLFGLHRWQSMRFASNAQVTLNTDDNVARFSLDEPNAKQEIQSRGTKKQKRPKMSRKAKLNELKWYRLKAKKKMKSPNPEVRIRYKLEKAKRKEEWLLEKLRKFEVPKAPEPVHDPESLTEEERFYLRRTGEKKKNYVPVGRRGVFGGVVLNMHLHWKNHETVKVICKPCKPGQIHEYADEIARLSKGTVIDIKANTIIFYRGKNYVRPEVMSPPDTLSKQKALEKYRFEQSLEHTGLCIEKLEKDLEEYHNYMALYKTSEDSVTATTHPNQ